MGSHGAAVVAGACSPIVAERVACFGVAPFPATSVCDGALKSLSGSVTGIVGSQVLTHEAAVGEIGNLTPATEVHDTFTTEHMMRMKNIAINGTTGHLDCAIDMVDQERVPGAVLVY